MQSISYVIMKNTEMKVKKLFHTYFHPGIMLSFIENLFTVHSTRTVTCLPYSANSSLSIFNANFVFCH